MSSEAIAPVIMKRLGTALFLQKQRQAQAQKAAESVDYLAQEGVLPTAEKEEKE